jgi:4-amino-4-deoxy-L-arabinose transferase-like glycosyltransferase
VSGAKSARRGATSAFWVGFASMASACGHLLVISEVTVTTPPAPSIGPRPSDFSISALLGLVAFLPRLYVAIAWPREPVWDGHYYDFGARRIAAGLGYSDGTTTWHPWCHWPVGYSGLLAGVYRIVGWGPHVATITNAFIGTLLVVFVHRLARHELCRPRAVAAGILCAIHPGLILYSALLMTEPLSALAIVVAGWAAVRDRDRRPMRGIAIAGLLLGLGTLVHPTFIAFAPVLAFIGCPTPAVPELRSARLVLLALAATLGTACAVLPVLPWTLRNCRVMDRCTFVSTNGGWNLAIGSFERATGRFETLRATDGCAVVTGQVQQDACWRDLALSAIARDPARWLSLVPKKLGYTFDHESFAIEYLHEADPDRWPEPRREGGRELLSTVHRLLLTLAALALFSRRPRSRQGWIAQALVAGAVLAIAGYAWLHDRHPFYLLAVAIGGLGLLPIPDAPPKGPVWQWATFSIAATLITHAVFFGEDRYHIVVTPMLCILAAGIFRETRVDPFRTAALST